MTDASTPRPPRSQTLKLWLIIGSVVAVLAVVPAAFMGMMSVMASDAGVNSRIYAFIAVMMSFPLAIVVGPVGGWIAWGLRWEKAAWVLLFSPFAWVVAIVVLMTMGFGEPHPV